MTSGHDMDILLSPLSSLGPLHLNRRRFQLCRGPGDLGYVHVRVCAWLAVRVCQLSVPVPLCPSPVMSKSRYVLVPLCPCLVLPHFCFVPVPLPVLTHFCFAPVAFCLSPIAILVSVPSCLCRVLSQSYGEFCPSHMVTFVPVTW